MYLPVIDSHIHFDSYSSNKQKVILAELDHYQIDALISVSKDLSSARKNLAIATKNQAIKPAFGFHPEQALPTEAEATKLQNFIHQHQEEMVAIGEVGLPYYLRKKDPRIPREPYEELLESYIKQAATYNKPIVLHAVYEDASIVCSMLEKHSITAAHFHWFKGDKQTIEQMKENGYFISITPDVLYEQEIQHLVKKHPLSLLMVETDGPWPFVGPFTDKWTHPKMIHQVIRKIAMIKRKSVQEIYHVVYENTKRFYRLK